MKPCECIKSTTRNHIKFNLILIQFKTELKKQWPIIFKQCGIMFIDKRRKNENVNIA